MANLRRDNHYVPKLYLKQWSHDGFIPTYRLLVPNEKYPLWKEQSLKGIAFHQHLYTYLAGQEETDEFEKWLDKEFENPAQEAIERVVNERSLSPEHWKKLVRFAVAQDVRTPARLREFLGRQREILPSMLEDSVERSVHMMERAVRGRGALPESKNYTDGFPMKVSIEKESDGSGLLNAEIIIGRRLWLWNIRHLLTKTLGRLPRHRWTILHAPPGISWPTSDNPLIRLNFHDARNYNFGGGWGVENGEILLPLSPKHLLYTCIGKRPWYRGKRLDEENAQLMRKIIIEHADRYVFSRDQSDIHLIRPRTVCSETFKREQDEWGNWRNEQCQAEAELQR
ncbi:DUF4238 domain-containing protein [Pseudomonas sp. AIG]